MSDAWATLTDVASITGVTATTADLGSAQATIEIMTNRTIAVSAQVSPRDIGWLRYAVVFQAAWVTQHPDYFTRDDVQNISQDGLSVTWRPGTDGTDALILAPLAKRALSRLSWMKSRSIAVNTDFQYGRSQDRPGWWWGESDNNPWNWSPLGDG